MAQKIKHVDQQFQDWFLTYSSYVILERAVPHADDGLKPVQRRILHSMSELEDGRLNKVQTIVGHVAKYHPHGDMAIKDAMVTLGQKKKLLNAKTSWLLDTQGGWGNILTGDEAAAGRYIEARLSSAAKETLFNHKITEWIPSYDGRNLEPLTLPVKFPWLLVQGTEGIAVGLSCNILPHNFSEICDACISALRGEEFILRPDFVTKGTVDATDYQDGKSGSRVRVRATIEKGEKNTLTIREVPFSVTTLALRDSIALAAKKGKIKIKKVEELTSKEAEVVIDLHPGQDLDTVIQALYAFTKCEISIAPNAVVIRDNRPEFLGVSDILRHSTNRTKEIIKKDLEVRLEELGDRWHKIGLERIFIVNLIYEVLKTATSHDNAKAEISERMEKYAKELRRTIIPEDIEWLTELKLRKISVYDAKANEEEKRLIEGKEDDIKKELSSLTKTTIRFFKEFKEKYGKDIVRQAKLAAAPFEKVQAAEVALTNLPVYWNQEEGFVGTNMKKDVLLKFEVNEHTDVIGITKSGILKINRLADKTFFGQALLDVRVFTKGEESPIYNMLYTNVANGKTFAKRFQVNTGFVRDKPYLTAGENNKVIYLNIQDPTVQPPKVQVILKTGQGAKKVEVVVDFSEQIVKNKEALGNTLTKYQVAKVTTTKT